MRLDFNVLWIEDQLDSVLAYRSKIERTIRNDGFKLQTEFAISVAKAKKLLGAEIFGDHIDLILMDYDLGVAPMGDEGLVVVRKIFGYKDIIFYSADVAGLLKKVAEKKIQGIFCSTRDDLPDTVEGVCCGRVALRDGLVTRSIQPFQFITKKVFSPSPNRVFFYLNGNG